MRRRTSTSPRDREATAESLARRYPVGIIKAYRDEFFIHAPQPDLLDLGLDFVDTANANIRAFLRDKSRTLHVQMETMADGIADVWDWAAVEGDLDAARAECGVRYNTAEDLEKWQAASAAEVARQNGAPTLTRAMRKVQRIAQKLPEFVRSGVTPFPDPPRVTPRISVIVPTYNREDTLPRALDSVLAQTFGDYEILVVDDGSTDGTAALLAEYEARDERVQFLRRPAERGRECGP